ncbi:MAG: YIP1 family protein [Tabrizicola sp.]|nr:YIP1 family protein [Tabrizicola sp.]
MTRVLDLAWLSVRDPLSGARAVLAERVPLPARTAGLLLVSVASALLLHLGFLIVPPPEDLEYQFLVASPFLTAIVQWMVFVAATFLIYRVGRAFGGTGSLSDALLVVVWMQVIALGVQIVYLLALVVIPLIAALISLAAPVLFLWLLASFIAELHRFQSRWAVLAGMVGTLFAISFLAAIVLALIYGPEGMQNV